MSRYLFRLPLSGVALFFALCTSALAQTSLPRLALQYWQADDYPNRTMGHSENVWVEGYWEDPYYGHWEDWDEDGNDDTWVHDSSYIEGHFEPRWINDGYFPDGRFGSSWETSTGTYNINSATSTYDPASTNRGYLLYPVPRWSYLYFRVLASAPSSYSGYYSVELYSPAGRIAYYNFYPGQSYDFRPYVSDPGLYRIDLSYHAYSGVTPANGVVSYYFNVGPLSQIVVCPLIPQHSAGDAAFDPGAVATSGLPVTYSIVSGPATISNGAVLVTGDGTVTVRVSQAGATVGNTVWSPATPIDRSFTVSGTAQTINFNSIGNHTYGDAPFAIAGTATSGLPVSFSVLTGPATISGSTVTLTGSGNVTITASQAGNATFGPAPSLSRTFSVAPDSTAPSVPSNLAASEVRTLGLTLSWTASTDSVGVTQYEVQRNGTVVGTPTSPTFNVTGLTAGTSYSFAVRARDAAGNWSTLSTALSVTTLPIVAPRMALRYWQNNDYPNRQYGHTVTEWIEGHDENNDDGSGHMEDSDGDGNDDTWVPDTHWVSGYYYSYWHWDGTYPDGLLGSIWSTNIGTYSANDSSGTPSPTDRGYLISPHQLGSIALRAYFTAPSENCSAFGVSVLNPSQYVENFGTGLSAGQWSGTVDAQFLTGINRGRWTIQIYYINATNVTPASGGVTYYMWVGDPQALDFPAIPNHTSGDAPFALNATTSSGLPVGYSVLSGPATISGNTLTLTGEGTVVVRAYQIGGVSGATTYTSAYADQSFTVQGSPQTITFPALADMAFGATPPTLGATSTSGLPVVYSIVSGPATISGSVLTVTGVGTVTVAANQAGAGAYGPAQPVTRAFVVSKASQTITFAAIGGRMYGDSPFPISPTASSGLPVTLSATGPATVSGNIVTITGIGDVTLTASQAGSANYHEATTIARTFAVVRIPGWYYVTVVNGTAQTIGGGAGTTIALTANPLYDGYGFTGWSVTSGLGTIANAGSMTSATLTLGSSDVTVTASSVPFYTVTIQNGTIAIPGGAATSVSGPAGKVLDLTANADGGGQFFVNWSLLGGTGGYSTLTARTSKFTIGASNATLRANYVSAHSLIVRSVGSLAPGFTTGEQSSAGGIRGDTVEITATKPPDSASLYFDGWTVVSGGGMVSNPTGVRLQTTGKGTFVMGNSDAIVLGWYVDEAYKQHQIVTTLTSDAGAAPGESFSVTATSTAPSDAVVTDMVISTTSDYGDTWTTPSGWTWHGSANNNTLTKSTSASAPGVMLFRAHGSRDGGDATYASLPVFARVPIVAGGTLTISGGHADGSLSGPPGTSIPIHADIPANHVFVQWKITAGEGSIANPTSPNTTFTIVENPAAGTSGTPAGAVIQAEYQPVYPLTVVNGTGSLAGGPPGTAITITAGPGSNFAGWTLDNVSMGAGIIANPASATTTFTMGNAGASVRANYGNTLQKLLLWGATTTPLTGLVGATVPITALPAADGFYFDRWEFIGAPHGTVAETFSRSTSFTFGMGDSGLEASYGVGGTLTVTNGRANYDGGAPGRLVALYADAPPADQIFNGWVLETAPTTGTLTNVNSPLATFTMGTGNARVRATYAAKPPPPVVTAGSASGTVGVAFSYQILATNMNLVPATSSYSTSALPAGLSLNPASGVISGTPLHATASPLTITLTATNSGGTDSKPLTLTIAKAAQTITFAPLADKTTNDPAFTPVATASSGLAVTFSVVSGPITFTPSGFKTTGAGSATIRASQGGDGDYLPAAPVDRTFTITAGPSGVAPTIMTPPVGVAATVGQTVTFSVVAVGSDPLSYQWRRNEVALANGGTISGATSAQLTISAVTLALHGSVYDVVVTNPSGSTTSVFVTLTVTEAGDNGTAQFRLHRVP